MQCLYLYTYSSILILRVPSAQLRALNMQTETEKRTACHKRETESGRPALLTRRMFEFRIEWAKVRLRS
jgi:hypothetical protein